MPITGSDRYRASLPGQAGFSGRMAITDELIASSLKDKLQQRGKDTALQSQTKLGVAKLQSETSLKREGMAQEGQTARQRLTSAGDVVLREMISGAAMDRQKASDTAALARVTETGEQRRTTQTSEYAEQLEYDKSIDQYLSGSKKKGRIGSYTYNPEDEIEQSLQIKYQ